MHEPKVSIIIPAYNQAEYLRLAIQSVLDQTYTNFELIVVNDASPDHTGEVVKSFTDPRIKYIAHPRNRHLAATRNTGVRASSGEIIALLDADDLFHPEKLECHVNYLEDHPDIGVTYNARFHIDPSGEIFNLWRPAPTVSLVDFLDGFPFAPSDMVLRREWAFKVDLFDESYIYFSEDLDINCRLALAGCEFGMIDRALNYRRYYPDKIIGNYTKRMHASIRALTQTFQDTRCSSAVKELSPKLIGKKYLTWSYEGFIQSDTMGAQQALKQAITHRPKILDQEAQELREFLISRSLLYGGLPEREIERVFEQLPVDLQWLDKYRNQTIARACLYYGVNKIMWGSIEAGQAALSEALARQAEFDEAFVQHLTNSLLSYEREFGASAGKRILALLSSQLKDFDNKGKVRWLNGCYSFNQALRYYYTEQYREVIGEAIKAISKNPHYIMNRGFLKITFHALLKSMSINKAPTYPIASTQ